LLQFCDDSWISGKVIWLFPEEFVVLKGGVDGISNTGISGWALDPEQDAARIEVKVLLRKKVIWHDFIPAKQFPAKHPSEAGRRQSFRIISPDLLELTPKQLNNLTIKARTRSHEWMKLGPRQRRRLLRRILDWRPTRRLRSRFLTAEELKPRKVLLCREKHTGDDCVIKVAQDARQIGRYLDLYRHYRDHYDRLKILYMPEYIERWRDFDIWEFVPGYCYNWTEYPGRPGLGGSTVPVETVPQIIALSEDLDILDVATDFYWRNFVFRDNGRIAYVDGECLESGDSTYRMAYIYCLMFANQTWRDALLKRAVSRGLIQRETFVKRVRDMVPAYLKQNPLLWRQIAATLPKEMIAGAVTAI
jgi:hypothetical protein